MSESDIAQIQSVFLVLVALNDHFPLFYSYLPFFHPVLVCLKYSGNLSQITQSPTNIREICLEKHSRLNNS